VTTATRRKMGKRTRKKELEKNKGDGNSIEK
jgi:hypothetical protein